MNESDVDIEELRQRLVVDFKSGSLIWKIRDRGDFNSQRAASIWNSRYAGKPAFNTRCAYGYLRGRYQRKEIRAHRLIWALAHGSWPENEIDHINGNPSDNRLCNLREATSGENKQNIKIRSDNKSGYIGVCFSNTVSRWIATIKVDGRRHYLGQYDKAEDASVAYREAKERLHRFQPQIREQ